MLVEDAAKQLGIATQTLRLALQQGLFPYFGVAVKTSENRYTYYINEARLKGYLEMRDYEQIVNSYNATDTANRLQYGVDSGYR